MFKRAAMKTTLVHLLVVLSLVIESHQWPRKSVADQKKRLLKDLAKYVHPLDEDPTFRYLERVKSKGEVTIGGATVEQLLELDFADSSKCRDGSFAKGLQICEQAELEGIHKINKYCKARLGRLARLCRRVATSSEARSSDAPIDHATVDFFKWLIEKTGSGKLDKAKMKELIPSGVHPQFGPAPIKKHCLILQCSGKQSGPIGGEPAGQSDGDQLQTDSQQPMWSDAYEKCGDFFAYIEGLRKFHTNDVSSSS